MLPDRPGPSTQKPWERNTKSAETNTYKNVTDLGYVFEPGCKVPCKGEQMFFWVQAPQDPFQRQQWAQSPQVVSVGV